MAKLKILVVGAFPPANSRIVGGIATTCKLLIESDFRNYFDLILIDSTQKSNPPPGLVIRLFYAIRRLFVYISILVRNKPDSVLLFTAVGASVVEKGAMAWLARLQNRPVFLFPRGAALIQDVRHHLWNKRWIIPMMKGATHILCQGPTWQEFAINDLGYVKSKAPIIYNWSATEKLLSIGANRRPCVNRTGLKILFLGWLEVEKGIFDLLEACRVLSSKHYFELTIAGRGIAEEKARHFVSEYNMNAFIKFEGWAHDNHKLSLLSSADILVLPSWAEGFPNAIIEAMSVKAAVIVSAVGNVPDMLEHRKHAMIVPPKNLNALIDAFEELFENQHLREKIAEQGFRYANDNFSTQRGVERLANIIESAVKCYNINHH